MYVLAPERVHKDDIDNEAAALATREKGNQLFEPVITGISSILEQMMAGEEINCPPKTFGPDGPQHM